MKNFLKKFTIIFISLGIAYGLTWSYISTYIKNVILVNLIKEFKESGSGELQYKVIKNEYSPFGFNFRIISPSLKLNSTASNITLKSSEILVQTDLLIKNIIFRSNKIFDILQDNESKKITYNNDPEVKIKLKESIILNSFKNIYQPIYEQINYQSSGFDLSKNNAGKLVSLANISNENMVINFDENYAIANIEFSLKNLMEPAASLGEIKFSSSSKISKKLFNLSQEIKAREYIIDKINLNNSLFNINFSGKFDKSSNEFKLNLASYSKMLSWLNNSLEKWQVDFFNETIMHNSQQLPNDNVEIILKNGYFGKQNYTQLLQEYIILITKKLKEKNKS